MRHVDERLDTWVERGATPGLAYVHFDRVHVLHERCAGLADVNARRPVEATTSFHGFSVTKTLTALAVVQLAQAGRVDLDALVRTYLPTIPYAGDILVRHLLTHTAGLPNPLPLSWVHAPETDTSFDRDAFFANVFAEHPKLRSTPGERFAYSNLGYVLLGQLIERVTGLPYSEAIRRAVLEPSGITPSELGFAYPIDGSHATGYLRSPSLLSLVLPLFFDTHRHLSGRIGRWRSFKPFLLNGQAYGGTLGTATGYRKYLQALLIDGKLVEPAMRDRLFTEAMTNNGRRTGMAMGWFTGTLNGHPFVSHAGGGGGYYAEIRLYPTLAKGSVMLLNRTGLHDERLLDQLDAGLVRR